MIDVNCDLGEGLNNDGELMPYITSCNIACGGHAGDEESMSHVITLAKTHNVKIGAHPSYPDKVNFGRKSLSLGTEEFQASIVQQISILKELASQQVTSIHYIKPHGALYNDLVKNEVLADSFLTAIEPFRTECQLYVPRESIIYTEAMKRGFNPVCEAFADRNYNDDLSLVSRQQPNAMITDIELVIEHLSAMVHEHQVKTITGKRVPIVASTYCIHSDTANAVDIARRVKEEFQEV